MSGRQIERWGLTAHVPSGWDGRLRRRVPAVPRETTHPLLHLANFRLPREAHGDYGSDVVVRMQGAHLLIVLKEFDPDLADRGLYHHAVPWPLTPAMVNPHGLQRTLAGQSGIQRFFSHHGRAFCLYVVLGDHQSKHVLVQQANELLQHVRIGPRHPAQTAHFHPAPEIP